MNDKKQLEEQSLRKPRRSLQTILIIWFLLLSVVPLGFVTGYSVSRFEKAINTELGQRLSANVREVTALVGSFESYLKQRSSDHRSDTLLATYLATNSMTQARSHMAQSMRNTYLRELSIFGRDACLSANMTQDEAASAAESKNLKPSQDICLSENYQAMASTKGQILLAQPAKDKSFDLIAITKIEKAGKTVGYIEEIINLGTPFLEGIKKRLNLELIMFDSKGTIVAASHPDFLLYPQESLKNSVMNAGNAVFDLVVRDEPYGFMIAPIKWGEEQIYIAVGASKEKAKATMKNVNYAFFTMLIAIVFLVLIISFFSARTVMRPLNELVQATQMMNRRGESIEISVNSDNEIGLLADSFNDMAKSVKQARTDLEKKIKEIEAAYSELKETQSRLVHSAKMASLGQLVAGVAHELNNPIGFIFSNMNHLRDYSQKLLELINEAEKHPEKMAELKEKIDFDYLVQDMPKLINSCEDGARRTRDIVLGLRNFSRLEEAKLKSINLKESIEATLKLLSGEIKGRIEVHTEFAELPEVMCYASQINQVFMNILSNAAQAIDGKGEIWIKTQLKAPSKSSIQNPKVNKNNMVEISIKDSGKGMPNDVVEKIFDPFFTTKTIGQGTGLGLSISYGIVKKHDGDILVSSQMGKGTEFKIILPVLGPIQGQVQSTSSGPGVV